MGVTDRLHWVAFQKLAEGGGRGEQGCVCPRPAVCLGGQWGRGHPWGGSAAGTALLPSWLKGGHSWWQRGSSKERGSPVGPRVWEGALPRSALLTQAGSGEMHPPGPAATRAERGPTSRKRCRAVIHPCPVGDQGRSLERPFGESPSVEGRDSASP